MRRLQKVLLGALGGGVLLCGIGTGVAITEFSSLSYAGERRTREGSGLHHARQYL